MTLFSFFIFHIFHILCLVARVSTGSAVQQQCSSAADKGWRFGPRCHGIGGHPSGSGQGDPRYAGAWSAGRPWVARQDQTADTRQTKKEEKRKKNAPTETGSFPQSHAQDFFVTRLRGNPSLRFTQPPARLILILQEVTVFVSNCMEAEHRFLGTSGT